MQFSQSFVYFYPYSSRKMNIKIIVFHPPVLIHIMKKTRFFTVFFTPQGFTCKKRSILPKKHENEVMYTSVKVKTCILRVQNPHCICTKSKKSEKITFKKSKNLNSEQTCRNFYRIFCVKICS